MRIAKNIRMAIPNLHSVIQFCSPADPILFYQDLQSSFSNVLSNVNEEPGGNVFGKPARAAWELGGNKGLMGTYWDPTR